MKYTWKFTAESTTEIPNEIPSDQAQLLLSNLVKQGISLSVALMGAPINIDVQVKPVGGLVTPSPNSTLAD